MLLDRYVAVDLETTGGDPQGDRIMEIAAVLFDGGTEVAARSWLCDPGRPIPLRFQQLTGITADLVRGKPNAESVLPDLFAFAAEAPLVAWGADFDAGFLAAACRRAGLDRPAPVLDGVQLARLALPLQRNYRLGSLARALDIPLDHAHRATDDARACGLVFTHCLQRLEAMELAVLLEVLRLAPYDWPLRDLFARAAAGQEASGVRPRPAVGWIAPMPHSLHGQAEESFTAHPEPVDPPEVAAILGPAGPVAGAFAAGAAAAAGAPVRPYEHRPQQLEMAQQVTQALNGARHLLVEAGTGTGKSLAYLVPALLWARLNRERVVISTHTITLQEQLWEKDLPFLLGALGWEDVQVALAKGRSNYLCLRKWEEHIAGADFGTTPEERQFLIRTLPWAAETETGDRGELQVTGAQEEIWRDILSEGETCLGPKCKWFQRHCFAFRSRKRARDSQILIVNHALLFADLKAGGGVLPRYQNLIIDEAHHLEDVATEHLGVEVSQRDMLAALAHLFRGFRAESGPGLLPQLKRKLERRLPAAPPVGLAHEDLLDKLVDLVLETREAAGHLFGAVAALAEGLATDQEEGPRSLRLTPAIRQGGLWEAVEAARVRAGALFRRLAEGLALLGAALEDLEEPKPRDLDGLALDLAKQAGAFHQAAQDMDQVLLGSADDMVYWAEVTPGREGRGPGRRATPLVDLRAAPVYVGDLLREELFDKLRSVIMTSATLTVSGSFNHLKQRLGLADLGPDRLLTGAVASPFRYQEQALVLIPDNVPNPRSSEREFTRGVQEFLQDFLVRVGGRTLVLFTSHRQLRQVYGELKGHLEAQGLLLLAQGVDGGRSRLVEEFRAGDRAVLFGSASFWEGVDIPGEGLSCVVMVRLPFTPPGDPVQEARIEHLERRGLSAFFHLSLPQAVIRFKQGFGRLIRTGTDRGVVVVFDNRVHPGQTRYGARFLQSLPGPRVLMAPQEQVKQLAVDFLYS